MLLKVEENMNLVSVIVPVYNVEKYLKECIESIINQTYDNIEILLIDDGSTDGSGVICDSFMCKDKRIRVFHKENGGLSDARNYGIDNARGDYITFVDSDDYLSDYAIEILYRAAKNYHSDLVFTKNAVRFNDGDSPKLVNDQNFKGEISLFDQDEILEYLFYQRTNVTGAPGKLFSKRLFYIGIRFPYGVYFEDLATTYRFIMEANNIAMIDAPIYAYRMRNEGIIHQRFSNKKLTCISVTQKLYDDICTYKGELKKAAASRCCSCNRLVYSQIPFQQKENRDLVWREIKKYRSTVLLDNKARKRERLSCAISYLGQNAYFLFNTVSIYFKYKIMNK